MSPWHAVRPTQPQTPLHPRWVDRVSPDILLGLPELSQGWRLPLKSPAPGRQAKWSQDPGGWRWRLWALLRSCQLCPQGGGLEFGAALEKVLWVAACSAFGEVRLPKRQSSGREFYPQVSWQARVFRDYDSHWLASLNTGWGRLLIVLFLLKLVWSREHKLSVLPTL